MVPMWLVFGMVATPSLAYVAEVASAAGLEVVRGRLVSTTWPGRAV
jgi:hypothetical protein